MASNASKNETESEILFVGRFVYDVMLYTLPICGFPATIILSTDHEKNVYLRTNIVEVVGASVLRTALIMRDKWKLMFQSRLRSTGLNENEIDLLIAQLQLCCPLCRSKNLKTEMEVFLALCNELVLFCRHENVDLGPPQIIKAAATYIVLSTAANKNVPLTVEFVFGNCDAWKYIVWITDFINKFAIPYGSRDDVSDLFTEQVQNQWVDAIKKTVCCGGEPKTLDDSLQSASGSSLPGNREESPEPPKSPKTFKRGGARRKKRH